MWMISYFFACSSMRFLNAGDDNKQWRIQGGGLGAPAPPLRYRFKLAKWLCNTNCRIFSSETARSNRIVEASARTYRPCVRRITISMNRCCAHARTLFSLRALTERAPRLITIAPRTKRRCIAYVLAWHCARTIMRSQKERSRKWISFPKRCFGSKEEKKYIALSKFCIVIIS